MSPLHSSIRRNGSSSAFSTASAQPVIRSCSASESSGRVIDTISTLENWCWRISPRVSRPADPASARKHGVNAVIRIGVASSSSERMVSRTRLVRETSAVGMR